MMRWLLANRAILPIRLIDSTQIIMLELGSIRTSHQKMMP